jgi:hypothetical protein
MWTTIAALNRMIAGAVRGVKARQTRRQSVHTPVV